MNDWLRADTAALRLLLLGLVTLPAEARSDGDRQSSPVGDSLAGAFKAEPPRVRLAGVAGPAVAES